MELKLLQLKLVWIKVWGFVKSHWIEIFFALMGIYAVFVAKQKQEAARAKRTADAIAEAKSAQERIDISKQNQERLEAMYGESVRGIEVPAISEAQRAAREMGEPVLTEEETVDITKNPLKVLGGYRSSITEIGRAHV